MANLLRTNIVSRYTFASITSSPFQFDLDTYDAKSSRKQNWRSRSAIHIRCINGEHSSRFALLIHDVIHHCHSTQTLKILNLGDNQISAQGAQYLVNILETNRVRQFLFSSLTNSSFILHLDTHNAKAAQE